MILSKRWLYNTNNLHVSFILAFTDIIKTSTNLYPHFLLTWLLQVCKYWQTSLHFKLSLKLLIQTLASFFRSFYSALWSKTLQFNLHLWLMELHEMTVSAWHKQYNDTLWWHLWRVSWRSWANLQEPVSKTIWKETSEEAAGEKGKWKGKYISIF